MLDDKVGVVVEGVVRTKEGDWQPWRRHSTNKELAGANSLKGGQGCRKRPLQVMRQDAEEEEMLSCQVGSQESQQAMSSARCRWRRKSWLWGKQGYQQHLSRRRSVHVTYNGSTNKPKETLLHPKQAKKASSYCGSQRNLSGSQTDLQAMSGYQQHLTLSTQEDFLYHLCSYIAI